MRDHELYARILGIQPPWRVCDVELHLEAGEVHVFIGAEGASFQCPTCGKACPGYDSRQRRWRHLDTCQYRTILIADLPRIRCEEHGVVQVSVPWAEPGSRFTALFEALAIDWLQEARQLGLSWTRSGSRAVRWPGGWRGGSWKHRSGSGWTRRRSRSGTSTSWCATEAGGRGVRRTSLDDSTRVWGRNSRSRSMDMSYIASTRRHCRKRTQEDKFHVAKQLGDSGPRPACAGSGRRDTDGDEVLVAREPGENGRGPVAELHKDGSGVGAQGAGDAGVTYAEDEKAWRGWLGRYAAGWLPCARSRKRSPVGH